MKRRSAVIPTDGQVLMDHIRELRTRLLICAIVLVIGGVVGYIFYTPIFEWLRSPLGGTLYYTTPAGSFNFIIKVSSMVGVLAAVPFLIFQLIMFIRPVFAQKLDTGRVVIYTVASIILAVLGALFAFFVILPGALRFFAGFQVPGLSALIDANNYLNFVTNAIVTFIIVFQIPLLMIIIDRVKPISPKKLFSMEKYVILGGLIVSLMVPFAMDITTALLIASPIVILYNISVAIIIIRHKLAAPRTKRTRRARPAAVVPDHPKTHTPTTHAMPVVDTFVQPVDIPVASTVRRPAQPRDAKPLPGQHPDIQKLRAEAKLRKEREIAARVARYNTKSSKIINDVQ